MVEVTSNCETKWLIIIVSIILAVVNIFRLVNLFTADGKMDGSRIGEIVFAVIFLVLCVLVCYGAFTENACLCYIAFVYVIICLIVDIWVLVDCLFIRDIKCETVMIVVVGILIALYVFLAIVIWLFIQSIKH